MPQSAAQTYPLHDAGEWGHLHCSFCGKDGNHVRFLSAGAAGGKICDWCCWQALVIFLKAYLTPRRFR